MAVGDLITHSYVYAQIYSFGETTVDLPNSGWDYLYFHGYGLQFYAYQRYHIWNNRDSYFHLDAWDYASGSWSRRASSGLVSEQQSAGFGANVSAPGATYSYQRDFDTDLWRVAHQAVNGSYFDMWYKSFSGIYSGTLLRLRSTTEVVGWTGTTYDPSNHSGLNTDNQRGSELTDSLKTRFSTHP